MLMNIGRHFEHRGLAAINGLNGLVDVRKSLVQLSPADSP